MTLLASLLRELDNPKLSVDRRVELCCEIARDFENKGEYEERLAGMSWQALAYMLETRHKDLLKYRTPVRRRPRK
jgi:hypothetical protein